MKLKKIELLFSIVLLQSGLTATQASKLPTFQTSRFSFSKHPSILFKALFDTLLIHCFISSINGTIKSKPSCRGQMPCVDSQPHG
jgi:hypothetical protein